MNAAVCLGLPSIANLISRMPGGIAQGIIWGIMALGLYITFRLLDIADLTVDGSFATGGSFGVGTVFGFVFTAIILFLLFRPDPYKDQKVYSKRSVQAAN